MVAMYGTLKLFISYVMSNALSFTYPQQMALQSAKIFNRNLQQ